MTHPTNYVAHFHKPSPFQPGRWLVVYCVPGTDTLHAVEDCRTEQAAAERARQLDQRPAMVKAA